METKELYLLGANFRCAKAEDRQHLAMSSHDADALHGDIRSRLPDAEFALLSTCNRVELYLFSKPRNDAEEVLFSVLGKYCPAVHCSELRSKMKLRKGRDVFEHLLRVVCGMESQILGDMQIVQQLRESLNRARRCRASGSYLETAFNAALQLGSRVRSQTSISAGSASVATAAAEMLLEWARKQDLAAETPIVIVGAGEMAVGVARHLHKRRFGKRFILNRTFARAQCIASQTDSIAVPWEQRKSMVRMARGVIAAVQSSEPIISSDWLADPIEKFILDLGMPCNVEPSSNPSCLVVGIDSIREQYAFALEQRQASVPVVEAAIEVEIKNWLGWMERRPLEKLIKNIYLDVAKLPGRILQHLEGEGQEEVTGMQYRIRRELKQLLHPHVHRLRKLAERQSIAAVDDSMRTAGGN